MISRLKLIIYASNFLEKEIEDITRILNNKRLNLNDESRVIFENLLEDYKKHFEELEKEIEGEKDEG